MGNISTSDPRQELSKVLNSHQVPKEEQIKKIWASYDADKNNRLDLQEFQMFCKDMIAETNKKLEKPIKFTETGAKKIFAQLDEDNSGSIEFSEFVGWFHRTLAQ
eukprot:TRINITY_DN979_c0_g1_i1.p1 TRINITY_DN979_c0_g1~~TRINITY_DN979_c0_g1_i1.p1  ORF type:complete len:105 (+),score=21.89 TRINITY_DN979_c0_g1_i1:51-365(+)